MSSLKRMLTTVAAVRIQLLPLLLILAILSLDCNGANTGRNGRDKTRKEADSQAINPLKNTGVKTMIPKDPNNLSFSDRIGMPLSKMIGTSELIVYGSIKKVLDSTMLVEVIQKIAGDEKEQVIEVIKAKPDPFAGIQTAPYKTGQCYLLFLFQPKKGPAKKQWKMMGHSVGQEGQMPVIDAYIYFIDRYFEGIPQKEYDVNGVHQNIQRFEFPAFLNAMEGYLKCYQWRKEEKNNRDLPQKSCSEVQTALYAKKGFMHQYLVTETEHFIINK